ncbi:MAG: hypothetical protein LBJ00_06530 [Planctomycetaceae bacterium]|nr:hypothetical protein [Planctomycetaceae bacterium]
MVLFRDDTLKEIFRILRVKNFPLSCLSFLWCLYSSCFKISEAAVNLQRRALGKHNNVKRLFEGEAYRPTGYGIVFCGCDFSIIL